MWNILNIYHIFTGVKSAYGPCRKKMTAGPKKRSGNRRGEFYLLPAAPRFQTRTVSTANISAAAMKMHPAPHARKISRPVPNITR